ncbi:Nonribosomal peptide synthetase 12 [Neonectria ditissima]|uniref:Nonribosomal peptide synthetase 12 n=1 Tax=Neonectria ditissima TaxID=78410 RepID=A0A0P7BM75_9HYPO|nr:Nonribosomal peptide synthetase 12 [Neonectria ditissima]
MVCRQDVPRAAEAAEAKITIVSSVSEISIQDIEQIRQWNQHSPAQVNTTVHSLITQKCLERGEAPAIEAWDGTLSYAELDRLSSVLAAHLCHIGVGPETIVPLCFEKSRWVLVAMLAVMKAGGAYVLLDESQPLKRMQFVCREVKASIVVTSHRFAAQGQELGEKVVAVSEESLLSLPSAKDWAAPAVSASNALYIIFTSGSTGQPKGVVVEHSAFSSCIVAFSKRLLLDETCRVLQFSSYTWDTCMEEMLFTLVAGGCVCIPSNDDRMSNLAGAFTALRANWMDLAGTVSRSLDPADLPALKTLVLGGEALVRSDVDKWATKLNLVNAYGVTECGGTITTRSVGPDSSDASNIGHAAGCISWIVQPDDHDVLMPVGAIGELLVEGPIIARGYLNRPDLTPSVFIGPPAWRRDFPLASPPGRFYKTGDLCQYAPDGSLRYLGRKDSQVKIGGQRVELEEVEHHVKKCFNHARQVRVVFISAGADSPGSVNGLIAFIDGLDSEQNISPATEGGYVAVPTDAFRHAARVAMEELRKIIPGYMVPNLFLPLCKMPRLESGKTDTRKLKEEAKGLSNSQILQYATAGSKTKQAPESPVERTIQSIWANVLGLPLDQIGGDDDFFSLGGRSLDAMKVVTQARRHGLQSLTVAMVFKVPVLSALALAVSQEVETKLALPHLLPEDIVQVSDLDPGVLGHVRPEQVIHIFPTTDFQRIWLTPSLKAYDLWKITQPVDSDKLHRALQTVVDRHSILRTIFVPHQGGLLQVVLSSLKLPFTRVQSNAADHDAFCQSLCQQDSEEPLPAGDSYLHATLVSFGDADHTLILRTSHAQWDKDGLAAVFRDIVDVYHGRKPLSVAVDFSLYMQHRLAQKTDAGWRFWREYLQGASMTTVSGLAGSDSDRNLVGVMSTIPHPPPLPGLTVATLVKTAWALTLARLTQTTDLVFGHTVNGRFIGTLALEEVVGCCLNTIPIRVTIQPAWTARQLLDHVQGQYTQAMEYEMLEPLDIVKNCTPWSAGTDFGSVVTHDHEDVLSVAALDGGLTGSQPVYPAMTPEARTSMVWPLQLVTSSQESELAVGIMAFNDVLSQSRTQWLVDRFGEAMAELTSATERSPGLSPYRM